MQGTEDSDRSCKHATYDGLNHKSNLVDAQ